MSARTLQNEIGKKRAFEVAEQEAYLNILRTAAVLSCEFDRLFRTFGVSEATYNALRILRGHGPRGAPSRTIGQEMVAAVPDVTRIVDRLVKAGLAQRARSGKDRRQVIVRATGAGLELLEKLDEPVLALHRAQLGHVGRRDLATISRLMVEARAACVASEAARDAATRVT